MNQFTRFLPIILLFFSKSVIAQSKSTLGVQAGSFVNVISDDGESMSGVGFGGGLSAIISLNDHWDFRPEVNYQDRRFNEKYDSDYTNYYGSFIEKDRTHYNMHYLDIPLLFQCSSSNRFGFFFGPQFGMNIATRIKAESYSKQVSSQTGEVFVQEGTTIEKDDWNSLREISFVLGPSYKFDFGLTLEFRAQRSIFLFNWGSDPTQESSWLLIQLGCRYNLPLAKKAE